MRQPDGRQLAHIGAGQLSRRVRGLAGGAASGREQIAGDSPPGPPPPEHDDAWGGKALPDATFW